ncbi:hypothetical protein QJQ45_005890 [Haematococcus lacustris]|nr:hypothetical protein QJQ45_005890 [Haematococcus lacustris]
MDQLAALASQIVTHADGAMARLPYLEGTSETTRRTGLALLTVLALLLSLKRLRVCVLQGLEAVLTVTLLVLLIAVVLGLPVGIVYISSKGLIFLVEALLHTFPQLRLAASRLHSLATPWLASSP